MNKPRPLPSASGNGKDTSAAPFTARLLVLRKGFWGSFATLTLVWAISFVPMLMPLLDGPAERQEVLLRTLSFFGLWLLFGGLVWLISRRYVGSEGKVELREDQVTFNGERLCSRDEIQTALLIPGRREAVVSLKRRAGRPLRLKLNGRREGHELIRALGLAPHQSVATFSLPAMNQRARASAFAGAATVGLAALVAMPLLGSLLPAFGVVLAIAFYTAFVLLTRTTLHVGGDGLRIRYLRKTRFINHDDIERVTTWATSHTGIDVTLRSGEVVRLPTATHLEGDGGVASGIADLLESARTTAREDVAREESVLARGGHPAAEWLRRMRGLAVGANADHRTAPIDQARVWRVLENPSTEASARVGAAVLLATTADESERARLRVAAKAIAAPSVRVAIDAAASGEEDEALIEALDSVHGTEPTNRTLRRAGEGGTHA